MKKVVLVCVALASMLFSAEGRFQLGYAGTFNDGVSQNGFVIGGGGITDKNVFVGGDVSFEFYSEDTSMTIEGTNYGYGYSTPDVTTDVDLSMHTITPTFLIGHKYIRFAIGVPICTVDYTIKSDSQYTESTSSSDTNAGILLGGQVHIPFTDNGGLFIEPAVVIISGNGSFALRAGFEF